MTKEAWLILISDGVNKGLVKVIDSDKLGKDYGTRGIVCNIGDNAFYFYDYADNYDDEDGLERFKKDFSQEEINEQIVNQLIAMQEEREEEDEFDPEYAYYYYFLVENL